MFRLKKLRLRNFRSFLDSEIVFPARGLCLIRGRDTGTGESSGTGKSSVFLALAFVLDMLPPGFSGKTLQNWDTEEAMQVDLVLEKDGQEIVIGRGKKTFVKIGDQVTTGAKPCAEKLQQLLGATEIVKALTYRSQEEGGLFLTMTPAQKIEFLTAVLGLLGIEVEINKSKDRIKVLENELQLAQARHAMLQKTVADLGAVTFPGQSNSEPLRLAIESKQEELDKSRKELETLRQELQAARAIAVAAHDEALAALQTKLPQAQTFLLQLKAEEAAARAETETKVKALRRELQTLDSALQSISFQESELQRKTAELQSLRAGTCPTCIRPWDQSQQLRADLEAQIAAITGAVALRPGLEQKRKVTDETLKVTTHVVDPRIEKFREIESQIQVQIASLRASADTDARVLELQTQIQATQTRVSTMDRAIKDLESEVRVMEARDQGLIESRARHDKQLKSAATDLEAAAQKLTGIQTELNQELDFVALMGRQGFLGAIVDEVLQEIADEANDRIRNLANVKDVSIGFESEEDAGGARRIQVFVDVRGHKTSLGSGLSGGMKTSVTQVTDLAVVSVLGRRTGAGIPGWLCLDEVFDGQGTVTKETALENLRDFASDRLILVVDHGTEFKEAFQSTIDVEFEAGVSRIKP